MAWPFRKEESQDGKQQEQQQADIDALVEKLGVSFEARLKPLQETVTGLKTEWDTMKAAAAKEEEAARSKNAEELTDEEKRNNAQRAGLELTIRTNARITENEIISEIATRWGKFIPEIKKYFDETPVGRKSMPDYPSYCRNIVTMVIGKAAMDKGLSFSEQGNRFFLEDASAKTGGDDSPLSDPGLTWTDPISGKTMSASEQLGRLGIDPAKFVESQKKGYV